MLSAPGKLPYIAYIRQNRHYLPKIWPDFGLSNVGILKRQFGHSNLPRVMRYGARNRHEFGGLRYALFCHHTVRYSIQYQCRH